MNPVITCLAQYSQICKSLLAALGEPDMGFSDEKLIAIESAIVLREEKLEELKGLEIDASDKGSYDELLKEIKDVEAEIESMMRSMMSELNTERTEVKDQRVELTRLKTANRSYAGMTRSTEGYFIDKKK